MKPSNRSTACLNHLLAASLCALAISSPVWAAEEKVVHVYNWSDYIEPETLKLFTEETGIKVVYDTFDTNEILDTKLLTGKSGYDVVFPSSNYLKRQITAGAIRKLDKSKLPNLANMSPEIMGLQATFDANNDHAINWTWGTSGIAYNVDKVKKRLGDKTFESWADFLNPDNLAKLKDCGISVLDSADDFIPAILLHLGRDGNSHNPDDLKAAGEVLKKIRPYITKIDSSSYINDLANGDICLAFAWNGGVFQAQARADEAKSNLKLAYVIPKEGAVLWFDTAAIPADAPHPDEAHAFLNFLMRPDISAKNTDFIAYASGNAAAKDKVNPDITGNAGIYPSTNVMKTLIPPALGYEGQVQRLVTRIWTTFKTGQ